VVGNRGKPGAQGWDVNEAFRGRAGEEQRKQLADFEAKKQQAEQGQAAEDQTLEGTIYKGGQYRGPNGGVPPGLRDPSDPEPPPPPPGGESTDFIPPQITLGGIDEDSEAPLFGGRAGEQADRYAVLDNVTALRQSGVAITFSNKSGTYATDLAAAKGRISLRIELPTDGDVYYFAQLGGADGVSFDADEKGRGLLHGALAVLFAAAAAFFLRRRAS
jgi:hypothetical protein